MLECVEKIARMLISPGVLLALAFAILLFYIIRAGTNYLNIGKVFKDYFSVFSDNKKHLWIFFGVPALLSCSLIQLTVITGARAEKLVVFLSVLVSSFFAMLSILVSKDTKKQSELYVQVLKETASTVLLEIVLGMVTLIITFVLIFLEDGISQWIRLPVSFMNYYLIFVMLLNMLILFKRFKALIDNG